MGTTQDNPAVAPIIFTAEEQHDRDNARRLAERYRVPFIDLREQRIDPELFRTIQADLMFRYNFVPIEQRDNVLVIAAADPSLVLLSDELALLLGKKLAPRVATAKQIGDLLKRTEQSQRVLEQATEAFTLQVTKVDEDTEETISGDRLTRDTTGSPVVKLVETVIFTALERRASDIHIEARDAEVAVKYRIDGVLQHAMQPISKDWHSAVISRIKVLSDLDIAERRIPQDGRFRVKYKGRFIDLRVSIMPASHGEDAVLRVLDKETLSEKFQSLSLDVVGFSQEEMARFRRYIREPYGMVLVTGPTGSGKTTTLYAAINEIKSDEDKIITIEDPVEYQLRGITQIPVNEKKGLTFARGLRSVLRHDPDKIMVGEIRDQETAQIAIQSALTGHLVFTTVHAKKLTPAEILETGLKPEDLRDSQISEGAGCLECSGTGYHGRTAICELLDLSDRIREMIIDRRPTSEIKRFAREEGMITLRESGLAKARLGITTLREINKVTFVD